MRVIAGELGGRSLASPPDRAGVRPTTDRAREAVFSILGEIGGARVLDLFCGSGAYGIEAISRGASAAVLVDIAPETAERNARELGIADRCAVLGEDALRYLRRADPGEGFDLVFCDPPYRLAGYRLAGRLATELDKLLPAHLAKGARVILESSAEDADGLRLSLPLVRQRRYGGTLIRIHAEGAEGSG